MREVDLNCDLGEGSASDGEVLGCVTSANIACGFHAGDPETMAAIVASAASKGVAIGAHPGFDDLAGFGRRHVEATGAQVRALVIYQVGALMGFARAAGLTLQHVKPHGALYNLASANEEIALAVATAVRDVDRGLVLFGLSGGSLIDAGSSVGLEVAREAFVDRAYRADGSLVPRGRPGAVLTNPSVVVPRAVRMVTEGRVVSEEGVELEIRAETVGFHGDTPGAATLARAVREGLEAAGIAIRPPGRKPGGG